MTSLACKTTREGEQPITGGPIPHQDALCREDDVSSPLASSSGAGTHVIGSEVSHDFELEERFMLRKLGAGLSVSPHCDLHSLPLVALNSDVLKIMLSHLTPLVPTSWKLHDRTKIIGYILVTRE